MRTRAFHLFLSLVVAGTGVCLAAVSAQDGAKGKTAYEKHDQSALYGSLREVIVVGIDLYNNQGDHAGCYRLYHGALLSVKPFLTPELQRRITDGMKKADSLAQYSDRAFELRAVLDEIRSAVKPSAKTEEKKTPEKKVDEKPEPKKTETPKVEPKKTETPKVEPKKVEPKKVDEKKPAPKVETKTEKKIVAPPASPTGVGPGRVIGTVSLGGKAVAAKTVITLVSENGKKQTAEVKADGQFEAPNLVPGRYRVAVTGGGIPARYQSENTSGLVLQVQAGNQKTYLNLVP